MKYILTTLTALLLSFSAFAETVNFGGNQTPTCTLTKNSDDTLTFTGTTTFTTQSGDEGGVTVANNSAGAFSVYASVPGDWGLKPGDYTGTTAFDSGFNMNGANIAIDSNGTFLSNSGTDTMEVFVQGTSDVEFTAGEYGAQVVITCTPL